MDRTPLDPDDAYFKKTVGLDYKKQRLTFAVSQSLFSSFEVDVGTRLLLRSIENVEAARSRKVLDLGCGYGPLGLALKKADPGRVVHMVDRDALAVDFTRHNAELNDVPEVEVYASLGYDDVSANDFDLIVSNIPAKAGPKAITYWLRHAGNHLQDSGLAAVVVIAPLADEARRTLQESPDITIVFEKASSGYTVFHYEFGTAQTEPPMFNSLSGGMYDRGETTFTHGGASLRITTVYGLPEFDTLSFTTAMLMDMLAKPEWTRASVLCTYPGQGHLPVAISQELQPRNLTLLDRDLLALRSSQRNLLANEFAEAELKHDVRTTSGATGPPDLIVGPLREDEGRTAIQRTVSQAALVLEPGGNLLLAGSSTAVTRLIETLAPAARLRIDERKRKKGVSVVLFTKL